MRGCVLCWMTVVTQQWRGGSLLSIRSVSKAQVEHSLTHTLIHTHTFTLQHWDMDSDEGYNYEFDDEEEEEEEEEECSEDSGEEEPRMRAGRGGAAGPGRGWRRSRRLRWHRRRRRPGARPGGGGLPLRGADHRADPPAHGGVHQGGQRRSYR